jgi:hypothetical protein
MYVITFVHVYIVHSLMMLYEMRTNSLPGQPLVTRTGGQTYTYILVVVIKS